MTLRLLSSLALLALTACAARTPASPAPDPIAEAAVTELAVLGMIHDGHTTSERYSLDVVRRIIRQLDPEVVLTEIPPDRLDTALAEFADHGAVSEPRVARFPEYVDALIPLQDELGFVIEPCAAWTRPMADARRARLDALRAEQPARMAEVDAAWERVEPQLAALGPKDDPAVIHTDAYDTLVARGMTPYAALDLGAGGWTAINEAHFALVADALDRHRGRRVLLMFGAGHKGWFLQRLRARADVRLVHPITD